MLSKKSTGLVLYVKYDPTSGTFKDYSHNRHTITNNNVVPVRGKFGGAGKYNGTNAYLDCGNDSSLNITDAITIEAWVNMPAPTHVDKALVGKENSFAFEADHAFYIVGAGVTFFICSGGTWYETPTLVPEPSAGWHHLVGLFDGTNLKLYVDGGEGATTVPGVSTIDSSAGDVQIGRYSTMQYFDGTIDEVRIYNRALSAAEIAKHYKMKGYYGPLSKSPVSI